MPRLYLIVFMTAIVDAWICGTFLTATIKINPYSAYGQRPHVDQRPSLINSPEMFLLEIQFIGTRIAAASWLPRDGHEA